MKEMPTTTGTASKPAKMVRSEKWRSSWRKKYVCLALAGNLQGHGRGRGDLSSKKERPDDA